MYDKQSVIYSNVWEDPHLNREALQIQPHETVLSITSGGCNSLNLLLEDPRRVISIDCNPAQVALLDLKIAAFRELSLENLDQLFGVRVFGKDYQDQPKFRLVLYGQVRRYLPESSREFWDHHPELIQCGLIHCGAVEKFFAWYRRVVQSLYKFDGAERLFFARTLDEQREIFRKLFKNRLRLLNHMLLNRYVLGIVKGRHSFKHVQNLNFGRNFNLKLRHAFENTLLYENYFLSLILLGAYTDRQNVPPYLKPDSIEIIRNRVDRLENRLGTIRSVLDKEGRGVIHKFNLSNIFEWFDQETFEGVMEEVLALSQKNARLCYRYTLARPQPIRGPLSSRLKAEEKLAERLHRIDRAFMYESFHVYEDIA